MSHSYAVSLCIHKTILMIDGPSTCTSHQTCPGQICTGNLQTCLQMGDTGVTRANYPSMALPHYRPTCLSTGGGLGTNVAFTAGNSSSIYTNSVEQQIPVEILLPDFTQ